MKFLSLCSGIEAASVAWNPLGWETAAVAEVDPFCNALLEQRYPTVKNLGDINGQKKWPKLKPDLIVAGTPCQAFSVAGLRNGLSDPRGGLMLRFLEVVSRERPRYVLWENVPGVLSSNRGRDFGTLLWSLAQLGYSVTYRVLDSQWLGVAQRRRRVFVLGVSLRHSGDWRHSSKILLEPEGMYGDFKPSREAWEEDTKANGGGPSRGRKTKKKGLICRATGQANSEYSYELCPSLTRNCDKPIISTRPIRKLTPVECERLMGLPDNYTQISYRGKPPESCPHGVRYRALGNSMAVPVMHWIAHRINMFEGGCLR